MRGEPRVLWSYPRGSERSVTLWVRGTAAQAEAGLWTVSRAHGPATAYEPGGGETPPLLPSLPAPPPLPAPPGQEGSHPCPIPTSLHPADRLDTEEPPRFWTDLPEHSSPTQAVCRARDFSQPPLVVGSSGTQRSRTPARGRRADPGGVVPSRQRSALGSGSLAVAAPLWPGSGQGPGFSVPSARASPCALTLGPLWAAAVLARPS